LRIEHPRTGQTRSWKVARRDDHGRVDLPESAFHLGRAETPMERCSHRPDPPARPEEKKRSSTIRQLPRHDVVSPDSRAVQLPG
jgi:hypothetical protein